MGDVVDGPFRPVEFPPGKGETPPWLQIPHAMAWQCPPTAYSMTRIADGRALLITFRQPSGMLALAWTRSDLNRVIDQLVKHRDDMPPDGLEIARGPLPPAPGGAG